MSGKKIKGGECGKGDPGVIEDKLPAIPEENEQEMATRTDENTAISTSDCLANGDLDLIP